MAAPACESELASQSPQDTKSYRGLTLDNGLSVLLISDPQVRVTAPAAAGAAEGEQPHSANGRRRAKAADHEDEGSVEEDDDEDDGSGSEESGSGEGEDDGDDESGSDDSEEEEDEGEDEEDDDGDGSEASGGKGARGKRRGKGGAGGGGGGSAEGVKKAAAAMTVGVGSFSDPECMQGLSHYLEHMLFMGSAKFPSENEFDEYMTKYGGSSNAFTELELTNFHFEVAPEALRGALERFSQFFAAPLMLEGSLEREVLAVDSEFSGVMQSDACRVSQLMCHTARPGHPYRQFSWGNKKSLWDQPLAAGLDIRQHIQDYYKKHYGAERMNLVVLGGEDLDTLQAWVLELFADLPTGCGPRPSIAHAPPPFEGRNVYVMPAVRDHHEVSVTFQLPCLWERYLSKAEHYVAHLMGHEGPGSLLSYLKAKGWATGVVAGIDEDGYSQNSGGFLFGVTVSLTDAGLAAAPGCGLAAVDATFQYLRMLRDAGPQEWVWREMADIADIKFRFQEDEEAIDACTRLAGLLHLHQPQHVLAAEYLHEQYDPKLISEVLAAMDPAQSEYRVDLLTSQYDRAKEELAALLRSASAAPGADGAGGGVTVDTEPWFNMEAAWAQVPASLVRSWATSPPAPELRLPPPNPYIATDFTVHLPPAPAPAATTDVDGAPGQALSAAAAAAAAEQQEAAALAQELQLPLVLATPPALVLDQPGLRVWHKLDRSFALPRANVCLRLSSPAWCSGARQAALTHLALKALEDGLTEDAYLAEVAGLHYSTAPEGMTGVEVKVNGFTHKLPLLASRVLRALAGATFEGASWETVHEATCRKYRNMNMQVSKHASYERLHALCAAALHHTQLLPHAQAATLADVRAHVQQALQECHLEVLVHGNLTRDEALALARDAHGVLGAGCAMAAAARRRDCCVELPAGRAVLLRQPTRNAEEENCGVEIYFQIGQSAAPQAADRALLDLVEQLVYEPAYNSLRTKQQLGYTVHTGTRLTHGVLGFCVVVVSASHTAAQVDERVDAFLVEFADKLREMGEAEFEQHKAALRSNKLTKDRNLSDETTRHWDHVWNQRYDFLAREAEVAALQGITLAQVRAWWERHLHPASPARRKLAVHVVPTKPCLAAGGDAASNGSTNGTHNGGGGGGKPAAMAEDSPRKGGKAQPAAKRQKAHASPAAAAQRAAAPPAAQVVEDVEQFKGTLPRIPSYLAEPPPTVQAATAAARGGGGGGSAPSAMDCS